MTLISFRLLRENLGNMRELFANCSPSPWQKIARTPMIRRCVREELEINLASRTRHLIHSATSSSVPELNNVFAGQTAQRSPFGNVEITDDGCYSDYAITLTLSIAHNLRITVPNL